jgi:hypothetical protein
MRQLKRIGGEKANGGYKTTSQNTPEKPFVA